MSIYYKKGGFYTQVQESDCYVLSEDEYQMLMIGQENGLLIMEDSFGKPILTEKPTTSFHEWNGTSWIIPDGKIQAVITAEKSAKLAEINRNAQNFINELAKLDETPEFERETWSIQREEARAWKRNSNADTPTLYLISQIRGVPLDLLRQKAYEKAESYQQVAAIVAGQRQAYEDRLNAAVTLEQVLAIDAIYQLPQE